MRLTCTAIKIPKCLNITPLKGLLDCLKLMVMAVLARLGLLNRPEQAHTEDHHSTGYVLVMDDLSPSLIPIQTLMVLIKRRLPVIEYKSFLQRYGVHEDVDMVCSVCMDCVEGSHEIRELSNCSHVFHRECVDRWVDEGQVTCPLCRAMLFSATTRRTNSGNS